ncbi:MAG: GTP-binding protein [Candidatus Competibacteraceae bacterium]|nr:GTP-binding protein [Candidatus Competibacteraceae bacterium]
MRVLGGLAGGNNCVVWDAIQQRVISIESAGIVQIWDLSQFLTNVTESESLPSLITSPDQIQYTNAKVLLVGDTHSGKTGLTQRLATDEWKPSEDSTVGAWSTQWRLKDSTSESGVDREIWLWDFGGQADQRLVHQLYMDRSALILLLFNADQDDVLSGLRDWHTALRRSVSETIPKLLVAGRIDTGFKASRAKLKTFANVHGFTYHETSAKTGEGCNQLRTDIITRIPWEQMEKRTTPRIFKLIKMRY